MAEGFVAPRYVLEEGVCGFRLTTGELAGNRLMKWAEISTKPGVTALSSDPEGNITLSNPVTLGPYGNIRAYGLGWYSVKIYDTLADYNDNSPNITMYFELGEYNAS